MLTFHNQAICHPGLTKETAALHQVVCNWITITEFVWIILLAYTFLSSSKHTRPVSLWIWRNYSPAHLICSSALPPCWTRGFSSEYIWLFLIRCILPRCIHSLLSSFVQKTINLTLLGTYSVNGRWKPYLLQIYTVDIRTTGTITKQSVSFGM